MAENAKQMTLEEKLVQSIKDRELYALVADEDAITKLVERAVQEALFQPIRVPRGGYGSGFDERDSPLVAAARTVAKEVAQKVAEREIEKLIADETTGPLIKKFVVEAMPAALAEAVTRRLGGLHHQDMMTAGRLSQLASHLGVRLEG